MTALDRAARALARDACAPICGEPACKICDRRLEPYRNAARAVLAALDPPTYKACGVGAEAIEAALFGRGNKTFLSRGDRQTAAAAAFSAMLAAAREGS